MSVINPWGAVLNVRLVINPWGAVFDVMLVIKDLHPEKPQNPTARRPGERLQAVALRDSPHYHDSTYSINPGVHVFDVRVCCSLERCLKENLDPRTSIRAAPNGS